MQLTLFTRGVGCIRTNKKEHVILIIFPASSHPQQQQEKDVCVFLLFVFVCFPRLFLFFDIFWRPIFARGFFFVRVSTTSQCTRFHNFSKFLLIF
jgi:hypothetical protein